MRRLALSCLVIAVGAYPSFLVGSNCAEPIAIANGLSASPSPPSPSCEDTKGPIWCSKKLQKCHKPAIFRKCAASCGRCGHGACESNSLGGSFCGRKCNTAGKCRNKAGGTKAKCAFCEHSCGAQCAINALGKPLSMAMEGGEIVEELRTAGCVNRPGHESYCGKTGQAIVKLCTKVKGMKSCFGSCSPQCQGGAFPTNLETE